MSIIRVMHNKNNPYFIVNREIINDPNLSLQAKGLAMYLLSKPDNWNATVAEIKMHTRNGEKSIYATINELIANNYVSRKQCRNEKGHFLHYEYEIFESKKDNVNRENGPNNQNPNSDNRDSENRDTGNGDIINNNNNNNNYLNNKIINNNVETSLDLVHKKQGVNAEKINTLFDFWKNAAKHFNAKLDEKRRAKIHKALTKYDVEFLKKSILGCLATPFNAGKNDSGALYDDISLILRDSSHIERYARNFERFGSLANQQKNSREEYIKKAIAIAKK